MKIISKILGSEKRFQHILKSVSYRVLSSMVTFLMAWSITGKVSLGITISIIDFVVKLILYYFHERVWFAIERKFKK